MDIKLFTQLTKSLILSLIMKVCNIYLNISNTFCKELYTSMCNITKKLSFFFFFYFKILHKVTHNKDKEKKNKKKNYKIYKLPLPNTYLVTSVITSV